MDEPLSYFIKKFGFDISNIKRIVTGKKYSAVILRNGNIGVCANLLNRVELKKEDLKKIDLSDINHRIILNAYYNASLNYSNNEHQTGDIFEKINFETYENIVMLGLFKPILENFRKNKIKISVFDMLKEDRELVSMEDITDYVNKANAVILSSTTVFNNSFMNIVNNTGENCDIFLLGPSSIMNRDMFLYKNIKGIFGSVFEKNDERVLNVIENGYGTRKFLPFGGKIYLKSDLTQK